MDKFKLTESEKCLNFSDPVVYRLEHLQCHIYAGSAQKPQGENKSK